MWGGTHHNNMSKVQKILKMATRVVLNKGRKSRIRDLMEGCKWLYVSEMEKLQSLVTLWKMIKYGKPKSLRNRFELDEDNLIMSERARLQIVHSKFQVSSSN